MIELSTNEDSAAVKSNIYLLLTSIVNTGIIVCGRLYGNISAIVVRGLLVSVRAMEAIQTD